MYLNPVNCHEWSTPTISPVSRLTACVDSLDAIARGEKPVTPIDKFTKEEIEAATAMRDRMNNEPTAKKASKKLRGGTD